MKKLNVGIIGMGYIGESHIDAVRRIPCCNLYAVADTNASLAAAKAEKFGVDRCYAALEDMLNDGAVDVIHNCTPNRLHFEINRRIIESGRHLLSEKPLARNYAEAEALLKIAAAHPESVCGVNFNYRLNPMVQEMRARVADGDIGDIRIISGAYQQDWLLYDTDYNWRLEPQECGISCAVADIGSHWMDAAQHIAGRRITSVIGDLVTFIPYRKKPSAQRETFTGASGESFELRKIENEEYAAVLFKMEGGISGVFHVSEVSAGHGCCFGIEFSGSKASLRWNQEENDRLWVGLRDGENRYIIRNPNIMKAQARRHTSLAMGHPEGWNDAFCGNIRAFYDYIASGGSAPRVFSTLEEAAYIVKLTEAIVESSKKRGWVEITGNEGTGMRALSLKESAKEIY